MIKIKTRKVTIDVSEEKYAALELFIKNRDSTIEDELIDTFYKLYERVVPKQVKFFVDENSTNK